MAASRLDALLAVPSKHQTPTTAAAILSLVADANLRRPDLVLHFGDVALSRYSRLTRSYWDIVAQVLQAAADLGEDEIREVFLNRIMDRFPHSVRAFTLLGITKEARGAWRDAMSTYMDVIKTEKMAPTIYKRQVAVLKSECKTAEAVALLNHYLGFYSDDASAWAELCSLSLQLGRFSHALFAATELVLIDPANYAAHITLADVYMTCGGHENVLMARHHYAASLDARKAGNLRALYGLWLSCSILVDGGSVDGPERTKTERLLVVAQQGIKAVYRNPKSSSVGVFVATALGSDVITGKKRAKLTRE